MILNFKTEIPNSNHGNSFIEYNYIYYRVKIKEFELNAVSNLEQDNELLKCYVDIIEEEKKRKRYGKNR